MSPPLVDRMNVSGHPATAPPVGRPAVLSRNADDIRQLLRGLEMDEPDLEEKDFEEDMTEDEPVSATAMQKALTKEMVVNNRGAAKAALASSPKSEDTSEPLNLEEPLLSDEADANDDDDSICDEDDNSFASIIKKNLVLILALGALLVVVLIVSIINALKPDPHSVDVQTSQPVVTEQRFANDSLAATDMATYQDVMTIDKYIILDQDSCLFVFEGYAENARAFVKAYVDLNTYNLYRNGARIAILYERITLDGEDYYMKVRVNK